MPTKKRWILSFVLALALTSMSYVISQSHQRNRATDRGVQTAKQLLSQIDGLTYSAKQMGESDPLGWAVNLIGQGPEPRVVRSQRIFLDPQVNKIEDYRLDSKSGIFQYVKLINSNDRSAIRISIQLSPIGFLGIHSPFVGDLLALSLIVALATAFNLILRPRLVPDFSSENHNERLREATQKLTTWRDGAQTQLKQSSETIRDLVKEARDLSVAGSRSQQHVEKCKTHFSTAYSEIHTSRISLKDSTQQALQLEASALNLVLETHRLGEPTRPLLNKIEDLHRRVQRLRATHQNCNSQIQSFEQSLNPWTTDLEAAIQAFGSLSQTSQEMDRTISSTVSQIKGQSASLAELTQLMLAVKISPSTSL